MLTKKSNKCQFFSEQVTHSKYQINNGLNPPLELALSGAKRGLGVLSGRRGWVHVIKKTGRGLGGGYTWSAGRGPGVI